MKAVLCKAFGPAESLVLEDVASPVAKKNEILLDVHAAGVNFPDTLIIEGKYQFKPPFPFSPGGEAAGVVSAVGDFVLKRADGLWAYQLAVVVDDAEQSVTHIVRGEDLADNTPRQILLQKALALPTPAYLHTPLVLDVNGEKLSKQNGAAAVDLSNPLMALNQAAQALDLPAVADSHHISVSDALAHWVQAWSRIYNDAP